MTTRKPSASHVLLVILAEELTLAGQLLVERLTEAEWLEESS